MANSTINQIQISGTVYDIEDATAQSSLQNKQDTLVSGTNIKTINNSSILGSGNIEISGSVDIVQTTGTSTTAVMSQNAVSTELNSLNTKVPDFTASDAGKFLRVNTAGTATAWETIPGANGVSF